MIVTIFVLIVAVALSTCADILAKKSEFTKRGFIVISAFVYASVAVPVVVILRYLEFGVLFLFWEAFTIILGVALGSLFFKESFTFYRFMALVLALIALILSFDSKL